jgi:uncharacterized protein (DUF1499 family)
VEIARLMAIGLAALLLIASALVLGLRFYFGRTAEDRLWPSEDIAIATLRGPLAPNAFLACLPGYCAAAEASPSPVFALSADRLAAYWAEMITGEPRLVQIAAAPEQRRSVWLQRSALFGFPDLTTVGFVALAPDRSSLALYSWARYGRYDFGVNRARVLRWLSRLEQVAGAAR